MRPKLKDRPAVLQRHSAAMRIIKSTPTIEQERIRMLGLVLWPEKVTHE